MFRYVAALIAALACRPAAVVAQGTVVIRNVTVISMTGAAPAARQSVIVRDGRIADIGPSAQVRVPDGASVVDGTGKYLIPGLFEMHAHTSKTRAFRVRPLRRERRHHDPRPGERARRGAPVASRDPRRDPRGPADAHRRPVPGVPQ